MLLLFAVPGLAFSENQVESARKFQALVDIEPIVPNVAKTRRMPTVYEASKMMI